MGDFRRVVTGHDAAGRSVVVSDTVVRGEAVAGMPGVALNQLWGSDQVQRFPDNGSEPAWSAFFAPAGGYRLVEFMIEPDAIAEGASSDAAAIEARYPGLVETMDPARPGMHRSATVDLLYVLEGRIILELDDGSRTELAGGDVAVQNGTLHAWRNPWDTPCRVLAVIVGAEGPVGP